MRTRRSAAPYPVTSSQTPPLFDGSKGVEIESVEQVGDLVIRIRCTRDLVGPVEWTYADPGPAHLGNGMVCDSDNFTAPDLYEYLSGSSMYSSANIAELVDQPYPLQNWAVPQMGYAAIKET